MAGSTLVNGVFAGGIPFARFGSGPKSMLFLAGGPGFLDRRFYPDVHGFTSGPA